ncbi:MAG: hypothetical protein IKO72_09065 [Kiritimatiellae bacterium]|nr:hypothetical protein [Kiritimatiellia bacterium]
MFACCVVDLQLVKDIIIPLISVFGILLAYKNARRDQNIDLIPFRVKTLSFWIGLHKVLEKAIDEADVTNDTLPKKSGIGVASAFLDACFRVHQVAAILQEQEISFMADRNNRHSFALKVTETLRQEIQLVRYYFTNSKSLTLMELMEKFLDEVLTLTPEDGGMFLKRELPEDDFLSLCNRLHGMFPASISEMKKESWLKKPWLTVESVSQMKEEV